jgi:hypothetical protein
MIQKKKPSAKCKMTFLSLMVISNYNIFAGHPYPFFELRLPDPKPLPSDVPKRKLK